MSSQLLKSSSKFSVALGAVALLSCCGSNATIGSHKNAASVSLDSAIGLFIQAASPYRYNRQNAVIVTVNVLGDSVTLFLEYRPPFNQPQPSRTTVRSGECIYYYYEPAAQWLFDSATEEACTVVGVEPDLMLDWYTWELELGSDSMFHLVPPAPIDSFRPAQGVR